MLDDDFRRCPCRWWIRCLPGPARSSPRAAGPWLGAGCPPGDVQAITRAARMAVMRSSRDYLDQAGAAAEVQVGAELAGRCLALHQAITLSPTTKQRMSAPPASFMYSWTMMLRRQAAKALEHRFDGLLGFRERTTPDALGALRQLDHQRCATDHLVGSGHRPGSGRSRSPAGRCLAREQLQRAQLVPRAAMATDSLSGNTPIISNWRNTAQP